MTSNAEALLPKVERSIEAAVRKISTAEKLGDPLPAVWDGARRVWTMRRHEAGDPMFIEVITSVTTYPEYAMSDDDVRAVNVGITARAWSTQHRRVPQERQIYAALLKDIRTVPSHEAFEALLAQGLGEADELAGEIPEADKRLDSFLESIGRE
jgi:hypothetical protein